MVSLVKESLTLNLITLNLLGLLPSNNPHPVYTIYSTLVYFGITCLMPTLAIVNFFLEDSLDLMKVVQNTFTGLEYGCLIFKYFPFVFKAKAIRRVIYSLELPIYNNFNERQKNIREQSVDLCKLVSQVFYVIVFITCTTWVFTPLIMGDYSLPLDLWVPFDLNESWGYYLVYSYLIVAGIEGAMSDAAVDTIIAGLAWHAKCQVKLLKDNLQHLSEDADAEIPQGTEPEERSQLKSQIVYRKIEECVVHHNAILDYVAAYDEAFSFVVFSQFVISVVVICISLFHLMVVQPLSYEFFAVIIFISTMLNEIFLFCFFGSLLYEESNGLITAIYMGEWLDYDIKCRKALIILMERAKKPIMLTAGKILDLSLNTWATIIRRAYSLLAVLENFKE